MDNSNKKRILEGLLQAIHSEKDGHNFYLMAAGNTADERGREVFSMLAREEAEHVQYLHKQYKAILENGSPDKSLKLPKRNELVGSSPIFSANIRSRIKDAHMEMSALSIGIQLELGAIRFYRGEADSADDPFVKEFYNELVTWEQGHYNALLQQQELLKEDYWSGAGFAPF